MALGIPPIPRELLRDRRFLGGLLLRALMILLLVPAVQATLLTPFLLDAVHAPGLDPWTGFLARGGDPSALLYGPVMLLFGLPFAAVGAALGAVLGDGPALVQVSLGLALLAADLGLLLVLRRLFEDEDEGRLLTWYWLSPLVLFITYWHGGADVVPTLLVAGSLLLLRLNRPRLAGAVLGLGIAAKISTLAVLPFLLIFLWGHRRHRDTVPGFLLLCLAVSILLQGPWLLLSPGLREMLAAGGEIHRALDLALPLGDGTALPVMPVVYLLLLYGVWQVGRMNFNLLYTVLGAAYFVILLLSPTATGWYMWVVPFLVWYGLRAGGRGAALATAFGGAFVLHRLLVTGAPAVPLLGLDPGWPAAAGLAPVPPLLASVLLSVVTALGIVLVVTMLRRGLGENDFFGLGRRPLAVGVAGDSGTGKDTLAIALGGLFGEGAVTGVSGDDYHLFERRGKLWQALTHLDPRANDLEAFSRDALSLIAWRPILCRHYDHATGLFTAPRRIRASDVVLVTGLHALYAPALRARLNTAVFLDMDEELRRFFKIRRDVGERGHTLERVLASIERRRADYEAFILPQREHADIVFSLLPADRSLLSDPAYRGPIPLKLRIRLRNPIGLERLARLLVALCGAQVDMAPAIGSMPAELVVDGNDVRPEDIHLTVLQLVPRIEELLARRPDWQTGITGIMQMVVLMQLARLAAEHR